MKKILITGGLGFIGYHLAKKFLNDNHEVIIFDAFASYNPPDKSAYLPYLNVRLADLDDRAQIIRGDIRDTNHLTGILKEHRPEIFINLAAVPLATASDQMTREAVEVNLDGVVSILDAIRSSDCVERFVYTSTSFVYGNFKKHPAAENHPTEPIDVYGGTKLAGEVLTKSFGRRFGIEHTIVRPSAAYGPTDANRRVTQIFLENALNGRPLVLHDHGSSRVDFTYIKDLAEGFALAAFSPGAKNETFNITRGEGRTIRDLAEILKNLIPGVEVVEQPSGEIRPERGSLDISRAKKLLGYSPRYSLEKGMAEYVKYVRDTGIGLKK